MKTNLYAMKRKKTYNIRSYFNSSLFFSFISYRFTLA